jgi:hypothetical protein
MNIKNEVCCGICKQIYQEHHREKHIIGSKHVNKLLDKLEIGNSLHQLKC